MRAVPNFESYFVSVFGEVFRHGRLLKAYPNNKGYLVVSLSKKAKRTCFTVHSLVALAYHGKRPASLVIRHLNGNKKDNRPCNLAYGTAKQNAQDSKRNGVVFGSKIRGLNSAWGKLTDGKQSKIWALMAQGLSFRMIAKRIGVHHKTVSNFVNGVTYK